MKRNRGFTLIEVLIALAILFILATVIARWVYGDRGQISTASPEKSYYVSGTMLSEFHLEDGTRCVVVTSSYRGGVDCDWNSGKESDFE